MNGAKLGPRLGPLQVWAVVLAISVAGFSIVHDVVGDEGTPAVTEALHAHDEPAHAMSTAHVVATIAGVGMLVGLAFRGLLVVVPKPQSEISWNSSRTSRLRWRALKSKPGRIPYELCVLRT